MPYVSFCSYEIIFFPFFSLSSTGGEEQTGCAHFTRPGWPPRHRHRRYSNKEYIQINEIPHKMHRGSSFRSRQRGVILQQMLLCLRPSPSKRSSYSCRRTIGRRGRRTRSLTPHCQPRLQSFFPPPPRRIKRTRTRR